MKLPIIAIMLFVTLLLTACSAGDTYEQIIAEQNQKERESLLRQANCWTIESQNPELATNPSSCFRNGKGHGWWGLKFTRGDILIQHFVDGIKHGMSTYRWASGMVERGSYVNGKKQGLWVLAGSAGSTFCLQKTYKDDVLISQNKCVW